MIVHPLTKTILFLLTILCKRIERDFPKELESFLKREQSPTTNACPVAQATPQELPSKLLASEHGHKLDWLITYDNFLE